MLAAITKERWLRLADQGSWGGVQALQEAAREREKREENEHAVGGGVSHLLGLRQRLSLSHGPGSSPLPWTLINFRGQLDWTKDMQVLGVSLRVFLGEISS